MQNDSSPIHAAAGYGDLSVVKALLAAGANVNGTEEVTVRRGVGSITRGIPVIQITPAPPPPPPPPPPPGV
jgi:hypothetical protein